MNTWKLYIIIFANKLFLRRKGKRKGRGKKKRGKEGLGHELGQEEGIARFFVALDIGISQRFQRWQYPICSPLLHSPNLAVTAQQRFT